LSTRQDRFQLQDRQYGRGQRPGSVCGDGVAARKVTPSGEHPVNDRQAVGSGERTPNVVVPGQPVLVSRVMVLSPGPVVQIPFLLGTDHVRVTSTDTTLLEHYPADSATAERLWDALYLARAGKTRQPVADLEDAAFRLYLPMARTLAHTFGDTPVSRARAEQSAELGLAYAVLAWRQRTSGGFRRFARSTIMRQLLTP